ncbi:MAG: hypothetical protein MI924_07460 [Chloroflexales bacterium]|nr:hypothetical protein [Chloroflexales bacterium]
MLLSILYNLTVPLGEGPDEPGHMAYVFFLAREGRLPVQTTDSHTSDVPGEGHQPPLAYLLASPAVAWLPAAEQEVILRANPDFVWNGGNESAAFVRSSREHWPWQGATLAWRLTRGVSALLGAIVVICTYFAARHFECLSRDSSLAKTAHGGTTQFPLAVLAAALVAFNPQFLFTSALVTNDMLLAALSAGLFWLCVAWQPDVGRGQQRVLVPCFVAGVLLGLALLTKQSALLLAPLLLWASWRAGDGQWTQVVRLAAIWSTTAALIAGWWYLRNWRLYGDPFGLQVFRAEFTTQAFEWYNLAAWRGGLVQLYESFWARFGWMSLHPPELTSWAYAVLGLLALFGYVWLGILTWSDSQPKRASIIASLWLGAFVLIVMACAWTVSFALTAGLVAWQGRMLFPALPAIAIFLARGLAAWGNGAPQPATGYQRVKRIFSSLAFGVLLGLAFYLPLGVIAPAYEWRTLPPTVAQAQMETPVYARYAQSWERGAELRGWRVEGDRRAGETVTITLTWRSLEPIPYDWTVFLHLVDNEERIVAQDNRKPQHGKLPMPQWTPGDWLEDPHPMLLPPELPPGSYTLRVGLYLPEDRGRRQGVWAENGVLIGDYASVGTLVVPE